MSESRAKIAHLRRELPRSIREYSHEQKALWQKVPWLALQANGRGGNSQQLARCYELGLWTLKRGQFYGYNSVFVDLATGDIVDHNRKLLPDEKLVPIPPEDLDAELVIAQLQDAARMPDENHRGYAKNQADWRLERAETLGIVPDIYPKVRSH